AASIASKITLRATPFSFAAASTAINMSLLIVLAPAGRMGPCRMDQSGVLVVASRHGVARLASAARATRRLAGFCGLLEIGHEARFLDVCVGKFDADAVLPYHDGVAFHSEDRALKPATPVLRQIQRDLDLLIEETRKMCRFEQRP